MGKLNDRKSLPALEALRTDSSPDVRGEAAVARAQLADDPFIPLRELLHDTDARVRIKALCLLPLLADMRAMPEIQAARKSPTLEVRLYAAAAQQRLTIANREPPKAYLLNWDMCEDMEESAYYLLYDFDMNSTRARIAGQSHAWEAMLSGEIDELLALGSDTAIPLVWSIHEFGAEECAARWGLPVFNRVLAHLGAVLVDERSGERGLQRRWEIPTPKGYYVRKCPASSVAIDFLVENTT